MSAKKTSNEVCATDNVVRIEKPKRAILRAWDKVETIQSLSPPPSAVGFVNLKPADPNNVHSGFVWHCWPMDYIDAVYSEDLCVSVWVGSVP